MINWNWITFAGFSAGFTQKTHRVFWALHGCLKFSEPWNIHMYFNLHVVQPKTKAIRNLSTHFLGSKCTLNAFAAETPPRTSLCSLQHFSWPPSYIAEGDASPQGRRERVEEERPEEKVGSERTEGREGREEAPLDASPHYHKAKSV